MKNKPYVLYLSHGGGPLPLLGDEGHREMVSCLQEIAAKMAKPSAILVISAHWEEKIPTITSGARPPLLYDYTERGFDHGLFVPLKIMYPDADIPCVQLSLVNSLNPLEHIKIGQALRDLRYDNLLIIGSGSSFHNMKAFFASETSESKSQNESFENWLIDTCSNQDIDEEERTNRLAHWEDAPFARYCHPREEHLLPLHVCYGLAGTNCTEGFELNILNKKSSMYLWSSEC